MSDENTLEEIGSGSAGGAMPTIVYVLYIVAAFTGVPYLIGLILAYISRAGADEVASTHYQFQIRTFWIGLVYAIIGILSIPVVIGAFICLFTWIWAIVRSVKGLGYYSDGEPVPNPKTWLW